MRKLNLFLRILITIVSCIFQNFLFAQNDIHFAVIGDYGSAGSAEADVANLIDSWNVDFIITLGDNNYKYGEASTIDENIGQYFHQYIYPYVGSYGEGSEVNRFFPTLGNHDWDTNPPQPYYDYFELPNNERYYDFVWGNVHFFAIDSDSEEPDGVTENSIQGQWLQNALASSTAEWRVVYFHNSPYSSSSHHGSQKYMRWPFKEWGASVVLSAHDHVYERVIIDGFPYFVNGLGGRSRYSFGTPVPGSQVRYNEDYGAMLVEASEDNITFKFFSRDNVLVDSYAIHNSISDVKDIPMRSFLLYQNYPNPFNPKTSIRYTISSKQFVSLKVYDSLGKELKILVNEEKPSGTYEVNFSSKDLPSGTYFYTIKAGEFVQTKKMVLLR